jgi:hypothetical protein
MIRSRSYLFLIIIVLPLFEHGPRRTSGRSLKLRPEDVLTLIRRMTENCSKDGPNTRQLHVCPADPCPLIENDPIMSCLYEGSAEITIFQSLGKTSAFNFPNVEKSTARSCASQSADKSHPTEHYAMPLDSSLCEHQVQRAKQQRSIVSVRSYKFPFIVLFPIS